MLVVKIVLGMTALKNFHSTSGGLVVWDREQDNNLLDLVLCGYQGP